MHRDVKPANVMVLPSGEVKVMDFGIARLESARQRLTTTGEFIGTPLYTAPEQAKTEDVDGRADIFSLASVAYTLLTGRAAFMAPTIPGIVHRVVYEEPDPPSRFVRGLPADVERVLARALAKDPERRYPTAEAFAEDAEDVLAGQPPRHAAGDDLVVVEESDSPLAELLVNATGASSPRRGARVRRSRRRSRPPRERPAPSCPRTCPRRRRGAGVPRPWRPPPRAWASWPCSSGPRGRPPRLGPSPPDAPAPPPDAASTAPFFGPLAALLPEAPGRLRIDFDHPLRSGTLRVFVDDELALEEPLTGQKRTKALVFGLHEGSSRNELEIPPGLHEVRVEVRWDENVRTERIVGNFRPGATRRLEASLGRIRRDLNLEWK